MYNVIVVDDEAWICKLIRKIVDWEALGFRIVASAGDGLSALDLIIKHKPELVITDIRMPGLDGLGLIKAVREQNLDVEFIIISGYSDFEYARSAITFEALAYLLKPLDKEEFEETLSGIKEKLGKKQSYKNDVETSKTVILENALKELTGKPRADIDAAVFNEKFGTAFEDGCYYTGIIKRDSASIEKQEEYDRAVYLKFLWEAKEKYKGIFNEVVIFPGKTISQDVFIINTAKEDDEAVLCALSDVIKLYESDTQIKNKYSLTIAVGGRADGLNGIGVSYSEAVSAMKARLCVGCGRVIDYNKVKDRISGADGVIDIRTEKKLGVLFDVFDAGSAIIEINNIFAGAQSKSSGNLIIYHVVAYKIVELLFSTMQRKNIEVRRELSLEHAKLHIDDSASAYEIKNYISALIREFRNMYLDEKHENGDKLIIEIKRFITENYMSEISLDDIAKLVCLSPTYVSEIFKRKTGENFSEYLIFYRIEIAKNMLKNIRYKVVDVSYMVGYKDSKYFSRLFKKKVGVNPSDYRKLYL